MSSGNLLDVGNGLVHVVKIDMGGVADVVALPECEGIDEENLGSVDKRISRSISVFVPAVGSADFEARNRLLDFQDLVPKLCAGEVAAVQGLGTDGDGIDLVPELGRVFLDGIQVIVE